MDAYFKQIIEIINNIYISIEPEYWSGIAAGLLVLLLVMQLVRRRRRVVRRPEFEAKKDLFEREGFIDEAGDELEAVSGDTVESEPVEAIFETETAAEAEAEPELEPEVKEPVSFIDRLKSGLSKTRNSFSEGLNAIFAGGKQLDGDLWEELEELLITSDVGVKTSMDLIERLSKTPATSAEEVKSALKNEIRAIINHTQSDAAPDSKKPHVMMVVGVNGVGKTTTIGKLAAKYAAQGKKVLIAAADTFRAAAAEQLAVWAERADADLVKHKENADPAAVAYDGIEAAIARGADIVLIDTAGRLHTKVNLMEELKKIRRSIAKKLPDAPHEIIMVLDATTGQNAMSQAKLFHEAMNITGLVLTKLDGTAKGGIVISICNEFQIPLKYIGIGEQTEDLQTFDADQFVNALF